jgi:Ran GTPase-activating protein (RanGAP) involved in mRNA processing and transport
MVVNCDIGASGATLMSNALRTNSTLHHLFLSHNPLADDGAVALATALTHCRLETLDVGSCQIGDRGAKALGDSIGDTEATLETLGIRSNLIGDTGATQFAQGLVQNKSLEIIAFDGNPCSDVGASAIMEALR